MLRFSRHLDIHIWLAEWGPSWTVLGAVGTQQVLKLWGKMGSPRECAEAKKKTKPPREMWGISKDVPQA